MVHLAFYTYGTLYEEHKHPRNDSFHDYVMRIYEHATALPKNLWWSEEDWDAYPWWKSSDGWTGAQTLSLWADLQSVYRFAYCDVHAAALKQRKEWFLPHDHPIYCAWWVDDDHRPTWREGVERLEYLNAYGPSPYAFSFKAPFDPAGAPAASPTL